MWSQWVFFCTSKKYFKETIKRKAPPNAQMSGVASAKIFPYASGFSNASTAAAIGDIIAAIPTMMAGSTRRVPKTARSIPHVRKRLCQR
jgi:hypothetical protein